VWENFSSEFRRSRIKIWLVTDCPCWLLLQYCWNLSQKDRFLPVIIRMELTCSNSASTHRMFNPAPAKTILEKLWMEVHCGYLGSHRKHSKYVVLKGDQVTNTLLVTSVAQQCEGRNDIAVCDPLSVFTVRVNWLHLTANTITILQLSAGDEQFSKIKFLLTHMNAYVIKFLSSGLVHSCHQTVQDSIPLNSWSFYSRVKTVLTLFLKCFLGK
jgi:hypothetical protein